MTADKLDPESSRGLAFSLALVADSIVDRVAEVLMKRTVCVLTSADTAIIDRALGAYSSDYNDAPHEEIARIREALAGTVKQAFDRASVAVTGVPAAQLTARLNDNLRRHPDRQFDDSDIEPPTELDFGPEDDQRTSPVPQQTMAEVVSDGGERPRITESGPVRVKGE